MMSEFLLFIYRCNIGLLVVGTILVLSVLKLGKAMNQEHEKIIKITKIVIYVIAVALLIVNIIMIFAPTTISQGRIIGILYCLGCVFGLIYIIDKNFNIVLLPGVVFIILWILALLLSSHGAYDGVPYHDSEKLVNKYYITEVREIPGNYVYGSRYSVQSTPCMNYYVKYKVTDSSVATKVINGAQHLVEKIEDSKYSTNPYMEKYEIIRTYESFVPFFNYCTFKMCYRYKLYVPK